VSSIGEWFAAYVLPGLLALEQELLLFAAFWFIISALDEMAVDFSWLWLRLTGRARDRSLPQSTENPVLGGRAAVLVPAWQEDEVIGTMVSHTLKVWPQQAMVLYVGCYSNDPATITAAMKGAAGDPRVRLVILDRQGPTTKADCLNRLYRALCDDEQRSATRFKSVILHDAEDMVHPAALGAIDRALSEVEFVQLPVRPEPQPSSNWVAGHYSDEFAEAHAKSMVVRHALGAAIPAAGVGCGFARKVFEQLVEERAGNDMPGPFAADCLTEDYELGLLVSLGGGKSSFLRLRDQFGDLVATRAFFPSRIEDAVRQKARWVHGIAFQGWDRLGWKGGLIDMWMAVRDRRGPLTAIVLAAAYLLIVIEAVLGVARLSGWQGPHAISPVLAAMLAASFAAFVWRALWRFGFTAREYGLAEGVLAVLRIPVANVISIMAGRRAIMSYIRSLRGSQPDWDKTAHFGHPAIRPQLAAS